MDPASSVAKQGSRLLVQIIALVCGIGISAAGVVYYVAMAYFPAYVVEYSPWPRLALHAAAFGDGDADLFLEACWEVDVDNAAIIAEYVEHANSEIRVMVYDAVTEMHPENREVLVYLVKNIGKGAGDKIQEFDWMLDFVDEVGCELETVFKSFSKVERGLFASDSSSGGSIFVGQNNFAVMLKEFSDHHAGIMQSEEQRAVAEMITVALQDTVEPANREFLEALTLYVASYVQHSSVDVALSEVQKRRLLDYVSLHLDDQHVGLLGLLVDSTVALQLMCESPSSEMPKCIVDAVRLGEGNFNDQYFGRDLALTYNYLLTHHLENHQVVNAFIGIFPKLNIHQAFYEHVDVDLLKKACHRLYGNSAAQAMKWLMVREYTRLFDLFLSHPDDRVMHQLVVEELLRLDSLEEKQKIAQGLLPALREKMMGMHNRLLAKRYAVAGFASLSEHAVYQLNDVDYAVFMQLFTDECLDGFLIKDLYKIWYRSDAHLERIKQDMHGFVLDSTNEVVRENAKEFLLILSERED